jgi:hypothetical protein
VLASEGGTAPEEPMAVPRGALLVVEKGQIVDGHDDWCIRARERDCSCMHDVDRASRALDARCERDGRVPQLVQQETGRPQVTDGDRRSPRRWRRALMPGGHAHERPHQLERRHCGASGNGVPALFEGDGGSQ